MENEMRDMPDCTCASYAGEGHPMSCALGRAITHDIRRDSNERQADITLVGVDPGAAEGDRTCVTPRPPAEPERVNPFSFREFL